MKLTCDLCGGKLQVNPGGQGAHCADCGLGYTLERLREKLGVQTPRQPESAPVISAEPKPVEVTPEVETVKKAENPVSTGNCSLKK